MKPTTKMLIGLAMTAGSIPAVAETPDCPRPSSPMTSDMPAPATMPSMKRDTPMPSAMARPGTAMMDVTQAAGAKEHCMQPMLRGEEKSMQPPASSSR